MNAMPAIGTKPKKSPAMHNGRALTGVERAAVMMLALGQEHGAGVWKMLEEDEVRELSIALDPSSPGYGPNGITQALSKLDGAMNAVQTMVGDVGARANTLDSAKQNLDALKVNITTFKSNLEDVDLEQAMTELTSRQLAYQAALVATSNVFSLYLTDYLR